jgi:hypothetical protein
VSVLTTYLIEGTTQKIVEAELLDGISQNNLDDWQNHWIPALDLVKMRLQKESVPSNLWPQSSHWNWERKVQRTTGLLASPGFSVICQGLTQGMMILDTLPVARLPSQLGHALVYIDYLEVAPWNRRHFSDDVPRYQAVGSVLIRAAIAYSQKQQCKGRIGLHALPQANDYYTKVCGMQDLGPDSSYQNLRYFEMTPEMAKVFIEKGKKP